MAGGKVTLSDLSQLRFLGTTDLCAIGQRVWNRHPEGGSIGLGGSPASDALACPLNASGREAAQRQKRLWYGWKVSTYRPLQSESSTSFPST